MLRIFYLASIALALLRPVAGQGTLVPALGSGGSAAAPPTVGTAVYSAAASSSHTNTTASATWSAGAVAYCLSQSVSALTSVTDPGSNTYAKIGPSVTVPGNSYILQWWKGSIATGFTGVITAHIPSGNIQAIGCLPITPASNTGTLDASGTGTAASSTVTTSAFTTTQAVELGLVGTAVGGTPCASYSTNTAGYTYGGADGTGSIGTMWQVYSVIQTGVTASMKGNSCGVLQLGIIAVTAK